MTPPYCHQCGCRVNGQADLAGCPSCGLMICEDCGQVNGLCEQCRHDRVLAKVNKAFGKAAKRIAREGGR